VFPQSIILSNQHIIKPTVSFSMINGCGVLRSKQRCIRLKIIENALNECTHLLLVISPSFVDSVEVQCNWLSALDEGKVVVPILYQSCQIPFRLKSIQYIDFTSRSPDDKEYLQQLFSAFFLELTISAPVSSVPVTPQEGLSSPF
jgi:hypothetical protein